MNKLKNQFTVNCIYVPGLGIIIAVGTGAGVASTLFDKGVIFMKDGDSLLTGSKYCPR
jgi:hypothetical protein